MSMTLRPSRKDDDKGAGEFLRSLSRFQLVPETPNEVFLEHVKVNIKRGLPQAGQFKAHGRKLAVASGGPSLEDTYRELDGDIAAVNGSLGFLMDRGIKPWACGVLDAGAHMVGVVPRVEGVWYFLASTCHPKLFEHLEGCNIVMWHPSGVEGIMDVDGVNFAIGGGVTMGLRWIHLGYALGYREFDLHGLDSSYRGDSTHAYPDRRDGKEHIVVEGYRTNINFVQQVLSFIATMDRLEKDDVDPVKVNLFGEGLLQDKWKSLS